MYQYWEQVASNSTASHSVLAGRRSYFDEASGTTSSARSRDAVPRSPNCMTLYNYFLIITFWAFNAAVERRPEMRRER